MAGVQRMLCANQIRGSVCGTVRRHFTTDAIKATTGGTTVPAATRISRESIPPLRGIWERDVRKGLKGAFAAMCFTALLYDQFYVERKRARARFFMKYHNPEKDFYRIAKYGYFHHADTEGNFIQPGEI